MKQVKNIVFHTAIILFIVALFILLISEIATKKSQEKIVIDKIYNLQKQGQIAIPELIKYISWRNINIRNSAIEAIAEIGEPAIPILIKQLGEDDENKLLPWSVGRTLELIGTPTVPILIEKLKDKNWHIRSLAVITLGEIGDKRALPYLQNLSKNDDSEFIRETAKEFIESIQTKRESFLLEIIKNIFIPLFILIIILLLISGVFFITGIIVGIIKKRNGMIYGGLFSFILGIFCTTYFIFYLDSAPLWFWGIPRSFSIVTTYIVVLTLSLLFGTKGGKIGSRIEIRIKET